MLFFWLCFFRFLNFFYFRGWDLQKPLPSPWSWRIVAAPDLFHEPAPVPFVVLVLHVGKLTDHIHVYGFVSVFYVIDLIEILLTFLCPDEYCTPSVIRTHRAS